MIEDPAERAATLQHAWALCRRVMAVAARVLVGGRGSADIEYGDGVVTRIGTFQKFFTQAELGEYIETQLGTDAVPAAPDVFYVFRDDALREQFLSRRYRRRSLAPRKRISEIRFEQHRNILDPLMAWITDNGQPPEPDEIAQAAELIAEFGSLKRAFALLRRVTGDEEWEGIRRKHTEDLLVYLALARFRRRPRVSQLSVSLQRDTRAFFGTYKKVCDAADGLLFRAGNADAIDEACRKSTIGKLLPNALYVHRNALADLEPLLRVYEGCAHAYLGDIEEANLIKLHRFSGKVSYLVYPTFDTDPHPALLRCVKLSLRTRHINFYDYGDSNNPPILHRKEAFLALQHPHYSKFARQTNQEERHGLLQDPSSIGTKNGWQQRLDEKGFRLRGHQLIRIQSPSKPIGRPSAVQLHE